MESEKASIQEQKFIMLAVSSKKPFIVSKEKVAQLINDTNSKKENEFLKQMAKTFIENNLINEPVLKKLKKLQNNNSK